MTSRDQARVAKDKLVEQFGDHPDFAGAGLHELSDGNFTVSVNFFSTPKVDIPAKVGKVRVTTQVVGHARA
jgi:hypothetical protein